MRIVARLVALLLGLSASTLFAITGAPTAQAGDLDCADFSSQASAQNWFLNHGGPNADPSGLDSDGDGVACESNPCPCNESTSGGGGGGNPPAPAPSKKFHTIHLRVAKMAGHFKLLGTVPTYRGKFQIQRKLKGGRFAFFTRTKAVNPNGKVKIQVSGPKGSCFQVSVPATKKYKLTTKQVGCI